MSGSDGHRGGERLGDHVAFLEQQLNVRLVAFDQHDIVAIAVQDGLRDVALGMQRIRGHDAASEHQRLQHIFDPEQLMACVSDGLLGQRDAQTMAECREQVGAGAPCFWLPRRVLPSMAMPSAGSAMDG